MSDETDPLAQYVALEQRKRELEEQLKAVKAEASVLEKQLIEQWIDRGQQNATLCGMTAYITSDFFLNKRPEYSTERLAECLIKHGLERVVQTGYAAGSLKTFIKEQMAAGGELPDELMAMLSYGEIPRIRVRLA